MAYRKCYGTYTADAGMLRLVAVMILWRQRRAPVVMVCTAACLVANTLQSSIAAELDVVLNMSYTKLVVAG